MRGKVSEPYARDTDRKVYVTPAYFEMVYGRKLLTVREWARHGRVRSMWHADTLYVHLQDCVTVHADTPTRQRRSSTA